MLEHGTSKIINEWFLVKLEKQDAQNDMCWIKKKPNPGTTQPTNRNFLTDNHLRQGKDLQTGPSTYSNFCPKPKVVNLGWRISQPTLTRHTTEARHIYVISDKYYRAFFFFHPTVWSYIIIQPYRQVQPIQTYLRMGFQVWASVTSVFDGFEVMNEVKFSLEKFSSAWSATHNYSLYQ